MAQPLYVNVDWLLTNSSLSRKWRNLDVLFPGAGLVCSCWSRNHCTQCSAPHQAYAWANNGHREIKNYDNDFVDDDGKWVTVYCASVTSNFVVMVSLTTPNKVESRRPAIHKLRQVKIQCFERFLKSLAFSYLRKSRYRSFFLLKVMLIENSTNELFLILRRMTTAVDSERAKLFVRIQARQIIYL